MDAHAFEYVLRLQAVTEFGHGGVDRRREGDGLELLGRSCGAPLEHLPPGAQHVTGIVEPLAEIAGQRPCEESGERPSHHRIEDLALDGHLLVEHRWRAGTVSPARGLANSHLVERDGRREAFGVEIPSFAGAQRQKGIEVGRRAGGQAFGGSATQRKVEQHELQLAAARRGDADVVRLDVAVDDGLVLKVANRLDEFLAEAGQHLERQPALFPELERERPVASALEQQRRAPGHRERLPVFDDVGMAQFGQRFALGLHVIAVGGVVGDLEDEFLVGRVLPHQKRHARRAAAQTFDDGKSALQPIPLYGDARIDRDFRIGRGEFVLDPFEVGQKTLHRVVPAQHVGVRGELHEFLQAGAAAIHHVGQAQALPGPEFVRQFQRGAGRRLAAENQIGEAPQRKYIEFGAMRRVGARRLRGKINQAGIVDAGFDMFGAGGAINRIGDAGVAGGRLPVQQLGLERAAFLPHQDAPRPQGAMVEPLGMGVLESLGQVPHQLQTLVDVQRLATVANQVIEADRGQVMLEQERGTQLGILVVLAAQDTGVFDAFEHCELAPGLPDPGGALLRAGDGGQRVNAHPALHRSDAGVAGQPVLKAVALGQQLEQFVVADLPARVGWTHPRFGQATSDRSRLLAIDRAMHRTANALGQHGDEAVVIASARLPPPINPRGRPIRQSAVEGSGRKKDKGFDEGQPQPGLQDRRLALQQAGQALGFPVGEQERMIDRSRPSLRHPGPEARIARHPARPALNLDQEQPRRR